MARKASRNTSSSNTGADRTDDLWKDIYVSNADTSLDRQHELLIGSTKLNRYTGDGGGPENKLTVSLILLTRLATAIEIFLSNLKGNTHEHFC